MSISVTVETSRLMVLVAVLLVLLASVLPLLRVDSPALAPRLRGAAAIVVMAVGLIWMLVNRPVEGPILFSVTRTHGMTVADIPSVALFLVAGYLVRPRRRGRAVTRPAAAAPAPSHAAVVPKASTIG